MSRGSSITANRIMLNVFSLGSRSAIRNPAQSEHGNSIYLLLAMG